MTKLVKFDLGNGETVDIEVEDIQTEAEIQPCALTPGEVAARARKTFNEALDGVAPMVKAMKTKLNSLTDPGDELEVTFSIKMSGEVGAVVTKVGGEATYEVKLRWTH
ncbi:MAG: CU044_2847 family protein [Cyanobacteria bacterium P01_E01_bin.34]